MVPEHVVAHILQPGLVVYELVLHMIDSYAPIVKLLPASVLPLYEVEPVVRVSKPACVSKVSNRKVSEVVA